MEFVPSNVEAPVKQEQDPRAVLEKYIASPLNSSATWELALRKRVSQALNNTRDKTYIHGLRLALSEESMPVEKEKILATLFDFELSRINEYSVNDPGLNVRNLMRLALQIYVNAPYGMDYVLPVIDEHMNKLSFESIKNYLFSGKKVPERARYEKLLEELALQRAEINEGISENEPGVQAIVEIKKQQEKEKQQKIEAQQKKEAEVAERNKREGDQRNNAQIELLSQKLDTIKLSARKLSSFDDLEKQDVFFGEKNISIRKPEFWRVFAPLSRDGDYHYYYDTCIRDIDDKVETWSDRSKWNEKRKDADTRLQDALAEKWQKLRPALIDKIITLKPEVTELFVNGLIEDTKEKSFTKTGEDYARTTWFIDHRIEALENLIQDKSEGLTSAQVQKLNETLTWLQERQKTAAEEQSKEEARIQQEQEAEDAREREKKRQETKFDYVLEQIGTKATYLKNLYELESGYDLGYLRGYGQRGTSGGGGSVMSGAGVGVGAGVSIEASFRLEVTDGIFISMGDGIEDAKKRLGMEDFVAPHEIGHLMAEELGGTDYRILEEHLAQITSIIDSQNANHHLRECVIDAIGTKMALAYGVSDPFAESKESRLLAQIRGFISMVNVLLGHMHKEEEDKTGYEFYFLRAVANIEFFEENLRNFPSEESKRFLDELGELKMKAMSESSRLNESITEDQRNNVVKLYRKVLDIPYKHSFSELEHHEPE